MALRRFLDRADAGRKLAERLADMDLGDVVVLGLPRGGVVCAAEVAQLLQAPLDVIVVRKLGVPFQPELAMGAIGEDGALVLNDDVVRRAQVTEEELAGVEARERRELDRRVHRFRDGRPGVSIDGRTAVIVDDGIATGATARAALRVARTRGVRRIVLAVPVAPADEIEEMSALADDVVCLMAPAEFWAVGQWYVDFPAIADDEVSRLLSAQSRRLAEATAIGGAADAASAGTGLDASDREVIVDTATAPLPGHLAVPAGARGIVVFAHGSGSSRHSPRNRQVAEALTDLGLGTLLFDLLTPEEAAHRSSVFDIELLATRLVEATKWLSAQPEAHDRRICYFGASTGAAAALWAAAILDGEVAAVVARGGRPDLAAEHLHDVTAPTLLIVGGRDSIVVDLNRAAARHLRAEHRLEIVPGATHLFEEPGALDQVARLAGSWFLAHCTHTHTHTHTQ